MKGTLTHELLLNDQKALSALQKKLCFCVKMVAKGDVGEREAEPQSSKALFARCAVDTSKAISIFVVDDDRMMLELICDTLKPLGYLVFPFLKSSEALDQIVWFPPDLLITDYHMPGLTGPMLIKAVHERLGTQSPPCLVLSSSQEEAEVIQCFEEGATDYVSKPFVAGILLAKVKNLLGLIKPAIIMPESGSLKQIKEFKVLEELGRGGMGVVYKVRNHLGQVFALKAMRRTGNDFETLLRFRREIDVLSSVAHENIASIYHAGKADDLYYYCMELIDGQPLDLAATPERLSPEWLARILKGVASALGYVHERDILHRDVKPRNIIVTDTGKPYLVDFGLAKHLFDAQVTADANIVGTPQYLSPEQIAGDVLDGRSDLFALGAVGLEILSGKRLIEAENPMTCMNKLLHGDYCRAKDFSFIPKGLAVIIDRLIETERRLRYKNAAALIYDLDQWLTHSHRP